LARRGELSPGEVVIVDDSTLYGHGIREMVTTVLGTGRAKSDRAECISHQEAMSAADRFWGSFSVALVDAYDAHADEDATPVPVGEVVARLRRLGSPARIIVYSANFDSPYYNRLVRDATDAVAYYDASMLQRADGIPMRSALLGEPPRFQADVPTAEQVGLIGSEGDLAKAIKAYQENPQVWNWVRGVTPWRTVGAYSQRTVRDVAREILRMSPANRPEKVRAGRVLTDRNPDERSIRRVVQEALRLPYEGR